MRILGSLEAYGRLPRHSISAGLPAGVRDEVECLTVRESARMAGKVQSRQKYLVLAWLQEWRELNRDCIPPLLGLSGGWAHGVPIQLNNHNLEAARDKSCLIQRVIEREGPPEESRLLLFGSSDM